MALIVRGKRLGITDYELRLIILAFTFEYPRYCFYCGKVLNGKSPDMTKIRTVEHVIPLSRGGSNKKSNRAPCCHSCNRQKGSRTVEEFRGEFSLGKVFFFEKVDLSSVIMRFDGTL